MPGQVTKAADTSTTKVLITAGIATTGAIETGTGIETGIGIDARTGQIDPIDQTGTIQAIGLIVGQDRIVDRSGAVYTYPITATQITAVGMDGAAILPATATGYFQTASKSKAACPVEHWAGRSPAELMF